MSLQESLGPSCHMFDFPFTNLGTKVAVTACNITDASAFIFSNYNGLGNRIHKRGKYVPKSFFKIRAL
jgi:hypothetical protein